MDFAALVEGLALGVFVKRGLFGKRALRGRLRRSDERTNDRVAATALRPGGASRGRRLLRGSRFRGGPCGRRGSGTAGRARALRRGEGKGRAVLGRGKTAVLGVGLLVVAAGQSCEDRRRVIHRGRGEAYGGRGSVACLPVGNNQAAWAGTGQARLELEMATAVVSGRSGAV